MKLLAFADVQATDGHEPCRLCPDTPLQRWRVEHFFTRLLEIYKNYGCSGLLDLGDTLDDRSAIPVPTIQVVIDGLKKFPRSPHNVKLIGNHEQHFKDGRIHSGNLFHSIFPHIVSAAATLRIDNRIICAAAYPTSEVNLTHWLKAAQEACCGSPAILLGHFQVSGTATGSGAALTGIAKATIEPFTLTLLGHIHLGQAITPRAHYIGSPLQQNFGESGQEKRVAVVDTDSCQVEWVPITGFPQYHVLSLEDFLQQDPATSEDRYKVCLRSAAEAEKFFANPSHVAADPVYQYSVTEPKGPVETEQPAWTTRSIFSRYLDKVPPTSCGIKLEPEEMINIGLQIAESPGE
jgi:hypothetical protein